MFLFALFESAFFQASAVSVKYATTGKRPKKESGVFVEAEVNSIKFKYGF